MSPFGDFEQHLQISVGNYIPNTWVMFNWDIYQPLIPPMIAYIPYMDPSWVWFTSPCLKLWKQLVIIHSATVEALKKSQALSLLGGCDSEKTHWGSPLGEHSTGPVVCLAAAPPSTGARRIEFRIRSDCFLRKSLPTFEEQGIVNHQFVIPSYFVEVEPPFLMVESILNGGSPIKTVV